MKTSIWIRKDKANACRIFSVFQTCGLFYSSFEIMQISKFRKEIVMKLSIKIAH